MAKTITFRIIVTTLDFTSNIIVIGELGTAAGLSTFALVAGPLFYLAHEGAWNYLGPPGETVRVGAPALATGDATAARGFAMSRALAKTITFRTIATIMDFSVTYIVVRDLAIAAGLSPSPSWSAPSSISVTRCCGTASSRKTRSRWRCRRRMKLLPAPA